MNKTRRQLCQYSLQLPLLLPIILYDLAFRHQSMSLKHGSDIIISDDASIGKISNENLHHGEIYIEREMERFSL